MRLQPAWLAWGSVAVGLTLVVGGGFLQGYVSGVMLEIGAAFLLLPALVWVERRLEARIETVREETRASVEGLSNEVSLVAERLSETAARLEDLGRASVDRIAEARTADARAAQAFREKSDYQTIAQLLGRARSLNAVARDVAVAFPGTDLWLTFGPVGHLEGGIPQSLIFVGIRKPNQILSDRTAWFSSDTPEDFLVRVGEDFRSKMRIRAIRLLSPERPKCSII